jgi:signal peptidase
MWRRIAIVAGLVGAAAGLWATIGPAQLGGPVTYVVASGDSMEPHIRGGDLLLVRPDAAYEAGDVVAYQHRMLRRVVVHRIAGLDGSRFVMKGDNNDWLDSYQPTEADVVGTPWVRAPGVGTILSGIAQPRNAGLLVGALVLLSLGGTTVRARRRRVTTSPDPRSDAPPRVPSPKRARAGRVTVLAASCAAVGLAAVGVAAYAGTQPSTRTVHRDVGYRAEGAFTYEARVARSPAYPDGRVATGAPVFTELVPDLDVAFAWTMASDRPAVVAGTTSMDMVVSDEAGWSRRFVLQPETPFSGPSAEARGRVDVAELRSLTAAVQEATAVTRTTYSVTVRPTVAFSGTLAGQPVEDSFSPELPMTLEPALLRVLTPTLSGRPDPDAGNPLEPATGGSVIESRRVPNEIGIASLQVSPSTVRTPAVGVAASLLTLAACLWFLRRRPGTEIDEVEGITGRYGRWIVDVRHLPAASGTVSLSSFAGLLRLAEQHERLVLHVASGGGHAFAVHADTVLYRYDVASGEATDTGVSEIDIDAGDGHRRLDGPTGAKRPGRPAPTIAWDPRPITALIVPGLPDPRP